MILSFVAGAVDRSESLLRKMFLQVLLLEPFNITNLPCRKLTVKKQKKDLRKNSVDRYFVFSSNFSDMN